MRTKEITYESLKDAINISFKRDKDIYDLFDPNVKVNCIEEIVENVSEKILTYGGNCHYIGVYEKEKLIGYFVYREKQLISFALDVPYRQRKYLREFFRIIKTKISGHFMALLWNKNIRAIKYLQKHGMNVINQNSQITQLAY